MRGCLGIITIACLVQPLHVPYGLDPINDFANICNGEGPRNVPRHNGRPDCSQVRFAVGRLMLVGARWCEGVLGSLRLPA
ncbi:MAG: hypothetical protein RLZZ396_165 [Planctomycetota bacterium]